MASSGSLQDKHGMPGSLDRGRPKSASIGSEAALASSRSPSDSARGSLRDGAATGPSEGRRIDAGDRANFESASRE